MDGYILDLAAGSVSSRYQEMIALIAELALGDKLVNYSDEIGFVRADAIHRLSYHAPLRAMRTKLIGLRSKHIATRLLTDARRMSDKLDYSDLSKLGGLDHESVRAYADRRLTPELRDYVLDPTLRFLYGGEIDDFASTELFFLVLRYLGGEMLNARGGIDFLARGLAQRMDVLLGAAVTSVAEDERGVTFTWNRDGAGETIETADVCVISLSAQQMAKIYPQLDRERRAIVDSLTYNPLWKIALGVDPAPRETASLVQIPSIEDPDMVGLVFEHKKVADRAPAGKGLLSCYASQRWCRQHAEDTEEHVAAQVAHRLSRYVPGVEDNVEFFHISRWDPALLIAKPGTWSSLARFHTLTPTTGRIQFVGDYIGGSSTNSGLASGRRAAGILGSRY
jgi:oxygen-dependent protoporphyrinogen oxidase